MDVITVHENELVITQQAPVCFGFSPTYYEDYISYIEVSEKTIETYTRALRQFARFLENHNITLPEREHVIRYKKQLIEEGKEPTTISSYLNVVKCFFKWTASAGIYPNVADNVKGVKVSGEHKRDYFTVKQINEIHQACFLYLLINWKTSLLYSAAKKPMQKHMVLFHHCPFRPIM